MGRETRETKTNTQIKGEMAKGEKLFGEKVDLCVRNETCKKKMGKEKSGKRE